jgi:hypothetical protein
MVSISKYFGYSFLSNWQACLKNTREAAIEIIRIRIMIEPIFEDFSFYNWFILKSISNGKIRPFVQDVSKC